MSHAPEPPPSSHASGSPSLSAEAQMSTLLRLGVAWYWRQDAEFRFVEVSHAADSPGHGDAFWLGRTRWEISDLMPPSFWAEHQRVLQAHEPFQDLEYLVPDIHGGARYARWHSTAGEPLFDEQGRFLGYHGFGREVTAQRRAIQGLKLSQERFQDFAHALSDWMWETDAELKYIWVSESITRSTGQPVAAYIGKRMDFMHHEPGTDPAAAAAVDEAIAKREPFHDFLFSALEPGRELWISKSGVPYFDSQGRFCGYRGVNHDVTASQLAARRAAEREQRFSSIFEQSPLGMIEWDLQLRSTQWNAAAERIFGYSREEMLGQHANLLVDPGVYGLLEEMRLALIGNTSLAKSVNRNRHRDGRELVCSWTNSAVRNADGETVAFLSMVEDITVQEQAASRIEHLARHDALTDLPNRERFRDFVHHAMGDAVQNDWPGAVFMINMDRFKSVNDTLGHAAGDRLLLAASQRLKNQAGAHTSVARLGSDEFALLMPRTDAAQAEAVGEQLRQVLSAPYALDGKFITCTPTIGVALFPMDGRDASSLLQAADTAMSHGKKQGGNVLQFFTATLRQELSARRQLELDLRDAVRQGQLLLHFQPQVQALSGAVVGMEALVRWQHPTRGTVPPVNFIALAEEVGLISEIGDWVMDEACRTLAAWRREGLSDVYMAVNLSAHQLRQRDLAEQVRDMLQRHGLQGRDLELELTESAAMQDPGETVETLQELRELGVGLAIDDFGTGYSSLAYLKLLPIQRLKLDRSFVKDIGLQGNDAAICSATIALAHKLRLQVVAEGVETEVQRNYLLMNGCELLQGFLFSRPLPPQDAFAFAMARKPPSHTADTTS